MTDPTLLRINEGVQLHHGRGERDAARRLLDEIWDEIGGEQGDPLHVCVLAHAMADLQDDVREELVWDRRALAAADRLTGDRVAEAGVALPVAGLYPSLHLNLGECYRKLGELDRAREHLRRARDGIDALGDDEYGQLIRSGLERLTGLLAGEPLSVADRLAVHELVSLHGHLMDSGEFARLDELFSADVVYDVSAYGLGELHGCDAIIEASLAMGDANPVGHHVTNICVSQDADGTVRVRSKGIGIHADGRVGSVVYEDVVRREPAGWRIAYRKVIPRR